MSYIAYMRKLIVIAALSISACEGVPGHMDQAAFVIDAYEATYGDVSEEDEICVYETPVTYPLRGAPNCCKGDFWCFGCTTTGAAGARIFIARGLSARAETFTVRHEYTHALLWCMSGDMARDHDADEFAHSGQVDAPGSLATYEP